MFHNSSVDNDNRKNKTKKIRKRSENKHKREYYWEMWSSDNGFFTETQTKGEKNI